MTRVVTLIHKFGGKKEGLTARLEKKGKIEVEWPLNSPIRFWLKMGLPLGLRKGDTPTWILSADDLAAFQQRGRP